MESGDVDGLTKQAVLGFDLVDWPELVIIG